MPPSVNKRGLVPKLRFPEFREAGEWEAKQVGEVFKVTRGEVLSMTLVQDKKTNEASYPVYSSQTKSNGLSGYYSDFLYEDAITWTTDGANAGDVNYRSGKFYCTNVCGVLINTNGYANPCIAALINSVSRSHVSYVGNPKLMNGVMAKITIPFPTVEEQQKIADCLASLDARITLEAQKLDTLKTHKKGLMQQLFPAEGETLPKLRFPEFRDAGEWETRLLGDVVKSVKTGKLDANAMVANGQYRFYTCAKKHYQIDQYAFEGEALLIAGNGAYLGYIHHYIGKFNAYQRTYVLQNFEANVGFLKCLLDRYLPTRIHLEKKDGNTPYIVLSTITEMPLLIPKDDKEQQNIADCLTSLDDLISAQTQKLAALKTHKKGLMQQLFPVLDEVAQ
jgi:type I restriction enzyme S subunit